MDRQRALGGLVFRRHSSRADFAAKAARAAQRAKGKEHGARSKRMEQAATIDFAAGNHRANWRGAARDCRFSATDRVDPALRRDLPWNLLGKLFLETLKRRKIEKLKT